MASPLSRSAAISLLVAGAFFMENLDGTVVVTAMPQMAASFGVHPVDLNSGVSAYLLTLAVLIPASGWVANGSARGAYLPARSSCSPWPRRSARSAPPCPNSCWRASCKVAAGR